MDIPDANSIISTMGPRFKNWESLQANPHVHVFLPPVLKPNGLNIGFATHIFHFSLPLAFERNPCLCLDFLTCIARATLVVKYQNGYSKDISLQQTEPRVLMDGANGDRMLHPTNIKELVYFFRSTVSLALALDGDWTHAYLKDKNRWSPCLITITEVAPQGSSYKVNLKVLIKKMHLICNWFVEKSKFIRDRKCFLTFVESPLPPAALFFGCGSFHEILTKF